ncbi:MAG: leucine-rich repeat protein [Bacilli bacterium]|nr:leucine-rich repeat protein [Bacilli bacterium]
MKTIDLKSAKEIGNSAFKGCNSIKKLYISKDIEKIGKDAFKYLGNRSVIYIENFKTKLMVEGKYTLGKTTVTIDNKYFK